MGKMNSDRFSDWTKKVVRVLYIFVIAVGIGCIIDRWGDWWMMLDALADVGVALVVVLVLSVFINGIGALVDYAYYNCKMLDRIYKELTKDKETEEKQD